jgi:peptidoglycan/xylan/chitin deacetylase (PgdA/CDA1 family)
VSPASSAGVGTIVVRGPRWAPRFALTFDDGPGGGTEAVLERLERWGARGTFFLVGAEVERDPELAHAVRDAGHELGSHSMRHLDHAEAGRREALADMVEGAAAIERALGVEPGLYRAPYGHFVPVTLAEAERRRWTCVLWSASGEDWRDGESGESISERILADLEAGAIVLLHDARHGRPVTCDPMLAALDVVLDHASRCGLEAVTVSELIATSE